MICLNCGKRTDYLVCEDCRTEEVLAMLFHRVCYFKENDCDNEHILEYARSLESPEELRNKVPQLLDLYDASITDYYWCQYYKATKDPRYERAALEYLSGHSLESVKAQRILYGLIGYYLPDDFIMPGKWCKQIRERDDLAFDLYAAAADYYSQIGDYGIADALADRAEKMISDEGFLALWCNASTARSKIDAIREKIQRRKAKPYWPKTEERRRALASFYDERGISYPRITTKPAKVPENEFELRKEADSLPESYCAFWCTEVFGITAAKDICQIAAVRVQKGRIIDTFESLVRPWITKKELAAKHAGVDVETILAADDVDQVMNRFYDFVGSAVLMSTDALGTQLQLLSRATRYAGMKRIPNKLYELLDYAAETNPQFDGKNNSREYLLSYFKLSDGNSALERAKKNVELYTLLKNMNR